MLEALRGKMIFLHAIFILGVLADHGGAGNTKDNFKDGAENSTTSLPFLSSSTSDAAFNQKVIGERASSPTFFDDFASTREEQISISKNSTEVSSIKKTTLSILSEDSTSTPDKNSNNSSTSAPSLVEASATKHTTKTSSTFDWRPYASIASQYVSFSRPESTTDIETPTTTDVISTSDYDKIANFMTDDTTSTSEFDQSTQTLQFDESTQTLEFDQTTPTLESDQTIAFEIDDIKPIADEVSNKTADRIMNPSKEAITTIANDMTSFITDETSLETEITTIFFTEETPSATTNDSTNLGSHLIKAKSTPSSSSSVDLEPHVTEATVKFEPTILFSTQNSQGMLNKNETSIPSDVSSENSPILKNAPTIFAAEIITATTQIVPGVPSHDVTTARSSISHTIAQTPSESLATKNPSIPTTEEITSTVKEVPPTNLTTTTTAENSSTTLTTTTVEISTFNWRTFLPTTFGKPTPSTIIPDKTIVNPTDSIHEHTLPTKIEYRMSLKSVVGVLLITLTVFVACIITSVLALQRYKKQRMLDDSVALMSGRRGQSRVYYYDTSI